MITTDDYLISRKEIKTQKLSIILFIKDILNDPEYALDPTMMRATDIECPSCGFNEAVYFMTADQSETKIRKVYICGRIENGQVSCGKNWNSDEIY